MAAWNSWKVLPGRVILAAAPNWSSGVIFWFNSAFNKLSGSFILAANLRNLK